MATAQDIYDSAPIGSVIRFTDGQEKPPARFKQKVRAWEKRNASGWPPKSAPGWPGCSTSSTSQASACTNAITTGSSAHFEIYAI